MTHFETLEQDLRQINSAAVFERCPARIFSWAGSFTDPGDPFEGRGGTG